MGKICLKSFKFELKIDISCKTFKWDIQQGCWWCEYKIQRIEQLICESCPRYLIFYIEFTKEAQDSINQGYKSDIPQKPNNNEGGNLGEAEDNSVNLMGQHLILNEEVPVKSPYP